MCLWVRTFTHGVEHVRCKTEGHKRPWELWSSDVGMLAYKWNLAMICGRYVPEILDQPKGILFWKAPCLRLPHLQLLPCSLWYSPVLSTCHRLSQASFVGSQWPCSTGLWLGLVPFCWLSYIQAHIPLLGFIGAGIKELEMRRELREFLTCNIFSLSGFLLHVR